MAHIQQTNLFTILHISPSSGLNKSQPHLHSPSMIGSINNNTVLEPAFVQFLSGGLFSCCITGFSMTTICACNRVHKAQHQIVPFYLHNHSLVRMHADASCIHKVPLALIQVCREHISGVAGHTRFTSANDNQYVTCWREILDFRQIDCRM